MVHLVVPLMIASLIPFMLTLASKVGAFSPADNHETRKWQQGLSGWRQRAYWAHQNAFETLPIFFAAAIVAFMAGPPTTLVIALTWAYPALRIAYSACFVADLAEARSLVWMLSLAAILALFIAALVR